MKKKLFTLLTLLLCLCSGAWADDYYLFTPTAAPNPSHTGTLSGDFISPAASSDSRTIGDYTFTHRVGIGSALGSGKLSGSVAGNKSVDYHCKTTTTTFTVYLCNNSNSAAYHLYMGKIAEGDDKVTEESQEVAASFSSYKTFTVNSTTNTTVAFYFDNTNIKIMQIVATESGTAHKQAGEGGYALNFNKGRIALNSSKTISAEGLSIKSGSNFTYVSSAALTMARNAIDANQISFTTPASPGKLKLTWSGSGQMAYNTSASATGATNVASGTEYSLSGNTTYYLINTGGSGANVTKLEFVTAAPATTYDITFANADGATGVVPAKLEGVSGKITLPTNHSMWKEDGYSLTKWVDEGGNEYEPGGEYTVSGDQTLTAKFESNGGTTLDSRDAATTIKWFFGQSNGVPADATFNGTSGFVVAQATVAGNPIDVKLPINATSGKFAPQSNEWAQVNSGTQFTIPSANGAAITYRWGDYSTSPGTSGTENIERAVEETSYDLTIDNTSASSGKYYLEYIQVTLPGPTYDVDFTLTNVTKSTGDATVEGGTQYTATFAAAEGYGLPSTVAVTAGGSDITSNCTWTKATGTLTIPAAYVTGDIAITINGVAIAGSTIIKATMSSATSATPSGTLAGSVSASTQDGNKSPDSNGGYKFGSPGHYIGLTLATGNTFMAGDVINVHTTTASGQGTIAIYDTDKSTVLYDTETLGVAGDNKFVLPATVNGKSAVYICRTNSNSWNGYVDFIEVTRPNVAITLNNVSNAAYGFSTFCAPNNFTVTGATAYKASLSEGKLNLTEVSGIIPAEAGVILAADKGATASISYTTSDATADMTGNALRGTTVRTQTSTLKDGYDYFYAFQNTTNIFKLYNGEYFPANKAYVVSNTALSRGISMDFGETTGISNVDVNANDNIDANAPMYNLAGQKVGKSYKGIVIVNGKKVVRK